MIQLLLGALLTLGGEGGAPATPRRVACIGDSITFGARVADREHNAYPRQLAGLLGEGWEVRNFGAGGRTLSSLGDLPYVASEEFQAALAWQPHVSVVLLGTNDTCAGKRGNWAHAAELEDDARGLVTRLLQERQDARVILCAPTAMFPEAPELEDGRRADLRERLPRLARVREALLQVAGERNAVEFLDLSTLLAQDEVVDGVHTTPFGARSIARRVEEALHAPAVAPIDLSALPAATRSDFHEFPRHDFRLRAGKGPDFSCTLVTPHQPIQGRPWVLRARFFGHEPELDLELLSRGHHLAYADVADLYGSEAALERWDRLHELATELGLARRVTLEGMSRGALPVLAWASRRPELVEAIYLDNPVCDVRSWPGGRSGKRAEAEWRRCLVAHGLSEEQAWKRGLGLLKGLEPLSDARVPLFLVLGQEDRVVPPTENGNLLAAHWRAAGAPLEVWEKPGVGHHPHGLHPVAPLLRTLLAATGRGGNPATRPTPSVEYRGHAAGWQGRSWRQEFERMRELPAEVPNARVVFLGDSITQGLTGSADRLAREGGPRAFDRLQASRRALCLGLSGDRTEHLLYRVEHGALARLDPEVVVLAIGVNNVNAAGHTGRETAEGLEAVVRSLRLQEPQAHVLICGPFPAGKTPEDPRRRALDLVHERAATLDSLEGVSYQDLRPLFLDETSRPNSRMAADAIHLSVQGYEAWLEAIEPRLRELLAE